MMGWGVETRCFDHFLCCTSSVPSEVFGLRVTMSEAFLLFSSLFGGLLPFARERSAGFAEVAVRSFASPNLHMSALLWEPAEVRGHSPC